MSEPKKRGPKPKLELDEATEDRIRVCCQAMMSEEQIASRLGVTRLTFLRFKKRCPAVQDVIDIARGMAAANLKAKMWATALSGDKTMMIFLAKTELGMREKVAIVGAGGGAIETATFSAKELADMSDDELERARKRIRQLNTEPEGEA